MLPNVLFLVAGLVLLFVGGEALVRGAVSTANRLRMPPFLIGLTVVGFGTSMPELMVSVQAALLGASDIAIGNVVGSNIANILLILGAAALIAPIKMVGASLNRDLGVMLGVAVLTWAISFTGLIDRWVGVLLLLLLTGYLVFAAVSDRDRSETIAPSMLPLWQELAAIVVGLGLLMLGADFLVDSSSAIARNFGVSEAVIGLTVVAVGTSLPELAASVMAAFRRQSEIALGNVVGSNIFNLAGILGITAIVMPVPVAARFTALDIPVMIAVTALLIAVYALRGVLSRWIAGLFLVAYGAYTIALL